MFFILLFTLSFIDTSLQQNLINKLTSLSNSSLPFLTEILFLKKNFNEFDSVNSNLTLEKNIETEGYNEIEDFKNLNSFNDVYEITNEDQKLARKIDDYRSFKKLASSNLLNLLTSSQKRISPLNKVILGLIGPRLIKIQLDMMFGAVISEVIRKLFMPVLSFVIDKNSLGSGNTELNQQVPYSNLQDLTTSKLITTTPSPLMPLNTQTESQIDLTNPFSLYKQTQNYLSLNPSLQEKKSSQMAKTTENQEQQLPNQLIQQQIQSLIDEQKKIKQQIQNQIPNSQLEANMFFENYLTKENYSQADQKNVSDQSVTYDDNSNSEDQSLNQMEQDYDRAQRWNSVLKNIHEFHNTKDGKKT